MAYPQSDRLFNLTDISTGQAPGDLIYMLDVSAGTNAGDQSDRKQSYNDLFDVITRNVTNLSIQWADGDAVATLSSASAGRLRYSQSAVSTAGSFQVSENAAAYQNLIKGPASAGNLTANLLPMATAGDVLGDTAWAQLGSTTSRVTSFNPYNPGTALTSYGGPVVAIVHQSTTQMFSMLGLRPGIRGIFFTGTVAAPAATTAGATIFTLTCSGQYSTTPGDMNNGVIMTAYATALWAAGEGGASFEIATNKEGVAVNNAVSRLLINQLGCFHVAPVVTSGESTSGTLTLFQVGGSGYTTDNNALSFFADTATSGSAAVKNIVAQQKGSQTGALFETQSASGVAQFGLYPQVGTVCHFAAWAGSVNTPTVSGAGECRLFIETNGVLMRSQGQSDWGVVCGYEINNQTAGYTVKVGDTGTFFTNEGALGSITFTLPAIPTVGIGLLYVFYARTNQTIVLQLPASTVLRDGSGATSAAGTATSTAQYDLIRIVGKRNAAGASPEYIVESVRGTWTLA